MKEIKLWILMVMMFTLVTYSFVKVVNAEKNMVELVKIINVLKTKNAKLDAIVRSNKCSETTEQAKVIGKNVAKYVEDHSDDSAIVIKIDNEQITENTKDIVTFIKDNEINTSKTKDIEKLGEDVRNIIMRDLIDDYNGVEFSDSINKVLDLISYAQGTSDYGEIKLLKDVFNSKGYYSGRYKLGKHLLKKITNDLNLDPNKTYFDENLQDIYALLVLNEIGFDSYVKGEINTHKLLNSLATTWGGFPDKNGRSKYGKNKYTKIKYNEIKMVMEMFKS